ncbi:hypothetical protein niasHT_011269 [Heterodera trifolii]|uniref:Uncharacterized protein n=1 Tax=Heterodera trifolii TaxID=157864 RepID=A0ABD2L6N1_9BILA
MLKINSFSELPNLFEKKPKWKRLKKAGKTEEKPLIVRPSVVRCPKCLLSDVRFLQIHLQTDEKQKKWQKFEVIGRVLVEENGEESGQNGVKLAILLEIADISSNVCSALPIALPLWMGFAVDLSRIFVALHADIRSKEGNARQIFEVGADVLLGSVGAEIGGALGVGIGTLIKVAICTIFACPFGAVGALVTSVAGAAIGSIVGSAVAGTIGKKIIRKTMRKNGRKYEELGKEVREEEEEEEVDELGEEVTEEEEEKGGKRRQGAVVHPSSTCEPISARAQIFGWFATAMPISPPLAVA